MNLTSLLVVLGTVGAGLLALVLTKKAAPPAIANYPARAAALMQQLQMYPPAHPQHGLIRAQAIAQAQTLQAMAQADLSAGRIATGDYQAVKQIVDAIVSAP